MAKVSISEAARLAGISRQHLYKKHITPGNLSVETDRAGKKQIDVAELMRIFGELNVDKADSNLDDSPLQGATVENMREIARLETEAESLREQLGKAEDREARLLRQLDQQQAHARQLAEQLATATKLLEHRPAPETAPPKKRGLFARIFGKGEG